MTSSDDGTVEDPENENTNEGGENTGNGENGGSNTNNTNPTNGDDDEDTRLRRRKWMIKVKGHTESTESTEI